MRSFLLGASILCAGLAMSVPAHAAHPGAPLPPKLLMTYADSWRERAAVVPDGTALAQAPSYLNVIALSFGRPDMAYGGGLELGGTGFQYKFSGHLLHDAIALLKARHPATRVLLSIGSAAYNGWDRMDEGSIARLVADLGADGVDIDYEPESDCRPGPDGRVACNTDATFIDITTRLRRALPRPLLLSVAGWHVGAYGEGAFRDAPPAHSPHSGFMMGLFRSPAAPLLDLASIDAYDAGTSYDPMQAYRAYRAAWPGRLALGVEVPIRGATGPFYTVARTEALAREVSRDPKGGMMVYSMLEPPDPPGATPEHPDGAMLEAAACRGLGMVGCRVPAPPPGR